MRARARVFGMYSHTFLKDLQLSGINGPSLPDMCKTGPVTQTKLITAAN